MPSSEPVMTQIFPGVEGLDGLDLHRMGIPNGEWLDLPEPPTIIVDAEGVPTAQWDKDHQLTWLSPRSPRPFESLHTDPAQARSPLTLVDHIGQLQQVPESTATLVVLASTDGQENAGDLRLVRAARRQAQSLGAEVLVLPLGRSHPHREQMMQAVRAHLIAAGTVDLTTTTAIDAEEPAGAGLVILFTGLSGSGKSTVARALHHYLLEEGDRAVSLLDGDVVRRHLSKGLGFSVADRDTNVLRIGWVAAEIAKHGGIAIASPIAPFDATRRQVRKMVTSRGGRFFLVHISTPLQECERRDRKGLYAQARAGKIPDFTGISSPYEVPEDADLVLDTTGRPVEELRDQVLREVLALDGLRPPTPQR